ncbi:antibiotic biosynthesis monooxygenase [Sphingomonas sp. JC676]|uniref:putative quinol monooxygenase n=1 Tax=Sphingomonas sp. JC676 TaxID=2768065 RepID=UPI001657B3D6|nr:antibiotic biosynthesis monooxygenase family protein [Sphingomonas sp. JC676]MBC9033758.1 antibiotic biosynthesis monooxygenase [Sphingomonas sp. JC676]
MATEIACIDIRPGSEAAFEAGAYTAVPEFSAAAGCSAMRLLRSYETASRYWLIVEWTDVAAHEAFRATPGFAYWRSLVGDFFAAKPAVEHGLPIGISF